MALTLAELRKLPKAELITRHDRQAKYVRESEQLYRDELNRRAWERSANWSLALSVANTAVALAAVVLALIARFQD